MPTSTELDTPMKSRGFTLIELMVTVAIVAILASIAVPSYREYIIRGQITEVVSALADARVRMEQHFQDNRDYTTAPLCQAAEAFDNFVLSCNPAATATTYTVRALGTNSLAGFTYTVDETNARATVVAAGSAIENAGFVGNANCWVTRKGGRC